MQKIIINNHIPINPTSKKQHSEQTNLVKRVVMPILPLSSVDNHNCAEYNCQNDLTPANAGGTILPTNIKVPIIKTTNNQPCTDEISLQNTSSEAISFLLQVQYIITIKNTSPSIYVILTLLVMLPRIIFLTNVSNIMYGLF